MALTLGGETVEIQYWKQYRAVSSWQAIQAKKDRCNRSRYLSFPSIHRAPRTLWASRTPDVKQDLLSTRHSFHYIYIWGDCVGNEQQRAHLQVVASVLSMINSQLPPRTVSPVGNVTTTPTSCTDPHRVQTVDHNQQYQRSCRTPVPRKPNTLLRGFSRIAIALCGTVRMKWFIVLPVSHNSGRPTARLSQD